MVVVVIVVVIVLVIVAIAVAIVVMAAFTAMFMPFLGPGLAMRLSTALILTDELEVPCPLVEGISVRLVFFEVACDNLYLRYEEEVEVSAYGQIVQGITEA